jgi:hypothetical protein
MTDASDSFTFLTRLRGELVAASAAQSAPTRASRIGSRTTRRVAVALGALLLVAGTALAAPSSLFNGIQIMHRTQTFRVAGASHPQVRAFGLDPAAATFAFTAPDGSAVSVVADAQASCMLIGDHPMDDHCNPTATIAAGQAFFIGNDCSVGDPQTMRIGGLAPDGSASVDVVYSSGPGLGASVTDGAYLIQSTNPVPGGPYPTSIAYLDANGGTVATQPITDGNDLCMTAQTP